VEKGKPTQLWGNVDVDYAGDVNQRRSTRGYVFTDGNSVIS